MLNQETKKRIDSARNILVGKVPDPKAQVEQITTAMIYKFMDDMDKEAQELGGKARFFTNRYEKYSWTNIMDPKLGGHERLNIYAEAVVKMSENPHIPQLFRDIFKDSFLPYRSPETLSMFLKEINGFKYLHSEDLGDAFEYLLSVLGSQGDAGQFRTPRHIIDFIADVVDPKKDDSILDPACGTAGFLISAYKHILKQHKDKPLSPEDKKRMMNHIVGYDISPDMVKLSKVNMYLHGFPTPHIFEYDTLSSEEKWDETYDVIMANPPFMTPKGGIRPHKRFSVQANRAEVLFVNYIMEHLNNNGRAGIIVPEGIIFQSANAYKQLRKMLIEDNYLYAVVSLPSGVFNPYAGVKTSILLLDKQIAKISKNILFYKINSDGLDLGAQRKLVTTNDLPHALEVIKVYKDWIRANQKLTQNDYLHEVLVNVVPKEIIIKTSDHNLSGERYIEEKVNINQKWPMSELKDIFVEIKNGKNVEQIENVGKYRVSRIQTIAFGKVDLNKTKYTNTKVDENDFLQEGDILFSHINSVDHLAKTAIFENIKEKVVHGINLLRLRADQNKILPKYAIYIFKSNQFIHNARKFAQRAVNQASINTATIKLFKIPLPPLEFQKEIVKEIESYQSIIDSAKNIINNSQIEIVIKPEWRLVPLEDVLSKVSETINPQIKKGLVNYIGLEDIEKESGNLTRKTIEDYKNIKSLKSIFKKEDILYGKLRPNLNKVWYSEFDGICSTDILVLRKSNESILTEFYFYILKSKDFNREVLKGIKGAQLPRISYDYISSLLVPLPSPAEQLKIILELNTLRKIMIHDNKKLIEIFEKKIEEKINKIWCSLSS